MRCGIELERHRVVWSLIGMSSCRGPFLRPVVKHLSPTCLCIICHCSAFQVDLHLPSLLAITHRAAAPACPEPGDGRYKPKNMHRQFVDSQISAQQGGRPYRRGARAQHHCAASTCAAAHPLPGATVPRPQNAGLDATHPRGVVRPSPVDPPAIGLAATNPCPVTCPALGTLTWRPQRESPDGPVQSIAPPLPSDR